MGPDSSGETGDTSAVTPLVTVTRRPNDPVAVLTVRGRWDRHLRLDVHTALRKALAEHPGAIVVDLQGLGDLDGHSVPTWIAAAHAVAALQPAAHLLLCMPPTRQLAARLRRLGCTRYLTLVPSVAQARAAAESRLPLTERLQLRWLPPYPRSMVTARDLVGLACDAWGLPRLRTDAQEVMVDMVADAVTHARTDMIVTVTHREEGLYLSVRDNDPRLPPLRPPGGRRDLPGGRLAVVRDRASVWGASPAAPGKAVWAVLRDRTSRVPGRTSPARNAIARDAGRVPPTA